MLPYRTNTTKAPLADRMRPTTLDEVLGQQRWIGPDGSLRKLLDSGELHSLVLWGPPGCGKTTLAKVVANHTKLRFVQLSAVLDGVKQLREVTASAESRQTLLFIDEIHRWNKAQQDALLPHVESGRIVLVGATTENPSMSLNSALRSRVQLIRLDTLEDEAIEVLLRRALSEENGLGGNITATDKAVATLCRLAAGDARKALSDLERCAAANDHLTVESISHALQDQGIRHDRTGEDHYNVVSALIKSLRGSDPNASLHWLARMIEAGEDPRFIARRLIIFASEDVGNADPRALQVAVAAGQAVQLIGWPEARINLAQAVTFLACAPKSNASYAAINEAIADVQKYGALPVPLHLRNATSATRGDYGDGYKNPHRHPYNIVKQQYLPDKLADRMYYRPVNHGDEKTFSQRLAWWAQKLN